MTDLTSLGLDPNLWWYYCSSSAGLASQTPFIFKDASTTVGYRNYLTGIQLHTDGLFASEQDVEIRDGPTGPALWRVRIHNEAGGGSKIGIEGGSLEFKPPLRTSPNTPFVICMPTWVAPGAVFGNAQGYEGP